jgi:predicted O-methyltransferase YrrM
MTTLTAAPLAPLLNRLFEEADAALPDTRAAVADLSDEERARLMRSKTDYRDFYGRMKHLPLAVSRETGALLYMLARSSGARTIVEFGTSFGISTLHLAAALKDNGGGRLITSEFEPSKAARARDNLKAGGVIDLVEIREGDALKTLSVDLPEAIDLVLLDGAKALYPEILGLLESRLKVGALIVADNADMSPDYSSACARPRQATCPRHSPTTSNCRCGSANAISSANSSPPTPHRGGKLPHQPRQLRHLLGRPIAEDRAKHSLPRGVDAPAHRPAFGRHDGAASAAVVGAFDAHDEAQAFELGELTADGRVVAVHAGGEFDNTNRAEALDADQQGKQCAVEPDAGRRDERFVAVRLIHYAHDFEQGHVKRAVLRAHVCILHGFD